MRAGAFIKKEKLSKSCQVVLTVRTVRPLLINNNLLNFVEYFRLAQFYVRI